MKYMIKFSSLAFLFLLLQSCASVDLRTDALKTNQIENPEEKGRKLLKEAYQSMGYDKLKETHVYETKATLTGNPSGC
ncbi:hypothetical protein ACJD0Z_05485 [Flavobacteriaceae bacterium M23B6Z8]